MIVRCEHRVCLIVCLMAAGWLCGCSRQGQTVFVRAGQAPAGQSPSVDRLESVEVAGTDRMYWLHLPGSYKSMESVPLVVVLHDGGNTAKRIALYTGFSALSDAEGFVVAYPEAQDRHWNDGRGTADAPPVDDVKFISRLIDQLMALLNIDRNRVYVTGISNGAILVQRLGCELSGKVAGIACVAGTLPKGLKCTPAQPVSVLMIHGTADDFVPYEGGRVRGQVGGEVLSVRQTVDCWLTADGCEDRKPAVTTISDGGEGSLRVQCERYGGCSRGTEVVLYTIAGGGHAWPGGKEPPSPIGRRAIGPTSHDFDATRTIWEFFKAHPKL